jgi:hypothetical protein
MLIAALLWFGLPTGWPVSEDLSTGIVFVLLTAVSVLLGVRWPGPARGLAVGIGAAAGVLIGLVVRADLEVWIQGENAWFTLLAYASIAIAAHTLGTFLLRAAGGREAMA